MFEVNNDEKPFVTGKIDEKGRLRCPMCKGRGYFEQSGKSENGTASDYLCIEDRRKKDFNFKLPPLDNKGYLRGLVKDDQKKVTLPSIRSNNAIDKRIFDNTKQNKSNLLFPVNSEDSFSEGKSMRKQNFSKPVTANSNESDLDHLLLSPPKTPKNPQDSLRTNLQKLKESDWKESLSALKEIIQISRYHPRALEGNMTIVYRSLISLLKSFRSKSTRTACQAANELFSNVPYTQRPEFDELVNSLLQKTADTNHFVRRDANEALDSMIISIHPIHSVRTLVQKGITHRNSIVRAAAARLLVCTVGLIGVRNVFSGNKETRNRIVNAAARSLEDGCQEVRSYACRIMKMLMENEDFDDVLEATVNDTLIKRIEKTLITIKYDR